MRPGNGVSEHLARWARPLVARLRKTPFGAALRGGSAAHALAGDRCIEWEWVMRHLPSAPARVLDVGCVDSVTAGMAAACGLDVTGLDIRPIEYGIQGLRFVQGSLEDFTSDGLGFDAIVLCSVLEHIGLGGRYGSGESPGADVRALLHVMSLLRPEGKAILTLPVGKSAVFAPFHRVYGAEQVGSFFENVSVVDSDYWMKTGTDWARVAAGTAFDTNGATDYYALGLFVITRGATASDE